MKILRMAGLLLIAGWSLATGVLAAETANWTTDYAAALEQAKTQDRRVFLFFTGSDWCGWCKRLHAEVLSKAEFKQFADENLILVELDFPQKKKQSPAEKAQNQKLMGEYKVEGYPTVIVLDSSGKKVGELGYQPGGPGPFIDALRKL